MTKEELEKLEEKEYLFTVEYKGKIYPDTLILNNKEWRGSINEDYKVISYKNI